MWVPLVVLWLLWGSTYLGIAIVVDVLPALVSSGIRLVAGGLLLAGGLVITRGPSVLRIDRRQLASVVILGVGILGFGLGTLALAERYVPSGVAALVVSANPLWIVLLRMRAGDRPSRLTLIGVAIGLAGLATMLLPGGTVPRAGSEADVAIWSLVLLLGSLSWAYWSWRSSGFRMPANPLAATVYELFIGGIFLAGLGLASGERMSLSGMTPVAWTAWIGLAVASAIGYAAFTWLLARAPLSLLSTYAYVNPVVAVLLGSLLLGEAITRDVVLGLVVVLGGVVLVIRGERGPGSVG